MKKQIPRCPCMSPIGFIVNLATIAICLYVPIVIWLRYPDAEAMIILGTVTAVILSGSRLLYYKWCKYKERRCAENECRCMCHYIQNCKCKCHKYCDARRAIEEKKALEYEAAEKKRHCEECKWDLDIPNYPCECFCHNEKVKTAVKQRSVKDYCSCRCHKLCQR